MSSSSDVAASFPQKIDRFEIRQVLGRGSQGIVYLADDPQLKRRVAIKSVSLGSDLQRGGMVEQLLGEARTVSRLQHANIVSIFDIGVQNDNPYLVLEYIDGQSLQRRIRDSIDRQQKFRIIRDILEGVAAAHAQEIVHCDLKPANILISFQGQAKVADFGLALLSERDGGDDGGLYGTPQYMAPEYIESGQHRKVSDVFSLGLVCYELLTGKPAFAGDDVYQVLHAIASSEVVPPAQIDPGIDERLESIIMKSLARNPAERYADAGRMLQAFNDYLALDDAELRQDGGDATVRFLLRRMRHKKDFPVFSQSISALNQASTSETESLTAVSNTILKDYSLTNKILRLVNSAYYNRGGGKISTISRAVVMLGIDAVKSIAAGLLLFEHMQNRLQAAQLRESAVQALFGGLLANSLARSLGVAYHEEAFVCALLQQLGKMLVRFYLHDEAQAIDKLMLGQDCSENAAVLKILGIDYAHLGISVAREWGFPRMITDSMQPLDFDQLSAAASATGNLQLISQFANALALTQTLPPQQQAPAIATLTRQFSGVLDLDETRVSALLESGYEELARFARLIQFDLDRSVFQRRKTPGGEDTAKAAAVTARIGEFEAGSSVEVLVEQPGSSRHSIEKALTDGIRDITTTLTGDYTVNQVMQMVLETIYRAFDDARVVFCLRDNKAAVIRARYGYGDDVERVIEHFAVPLDGNADVFQAALRANVDIRIDNTAESNIRDRIPDWFHRHVGARGFTLFPLVIRGKPIALIYLDRANAGAIAVTDEQLSLLKTLRDQAILAIRNPG